MQQESLKVTRYVRTVVDGKLVVRRPGDRVTFEEAARLGLEVPPVPVRLPQGRLPAGWVEPQAKES